MTHLKISQILLSGAGLHTIRIGFCISRSRCSSALIHFLTIVCWNLISPILWINKLWYKGSYWCAHDAAIRQGVRSFSDCVSALIMHISRFDISARAVCVPGYWQAMLFSVSLKVLLCFSVSFVCKAEIWSSRIMPGSSDIEFFNQAHNKVRNSFQTHHSSASVSGICTRTRPSDPLLVLQLPVRHRGWWEYIFSSPYAVEVRTMFQLPRL